MEIFPQKVSRRPLKAHSSSIECVSLRSGNYLSVLLYAGPCRCSAFRQCIQERLWVSVWANEDLSELPVTNVLPLISDGGHGKSIRPAARHHGTEESEGVTGDNEEEAELTELLNKHCGDD